MKNVVSKCTLGQILWKLTFDRNHFSFSSHFSSCFENCFESGFTTDCENNFYMATRSRKVCFDIKTMFHLALGILIQHFNWLKEFQFSCFDLFITRLAFSSPSKKNIAMWKLKTFLTNWKDFWSPPGMKNTITA